MNHAEILKLLDRDRRELVYPGTCREATARVTRLLAHDGSFNRVVYSDLAEADADEAVAAEQAYFAGLNKPFEWKVYAHDRPAGLHERLVARGFRAGAAEAVLVLDLGRDPDRWRESAPHPCVTVTRPDQVGAACAVSERVFKKDYAFTRNQLVSAVQRGDDTLCCVMAMAGGRPVSTGRVHFAKNSSFGSLYGGATLESHRRQGFYQATVLARAQEALRRGVRYLVVDAMPTSRPILEGLDFEQVSTVVPCEWRPGLPDTVQVK